LVKLRVLSGKGACSILSANGFAEIRRRVSHVIMQKKIEGATITVPVPDHKELKKGTLLSIIRQSGIDRNAFE